MLFKSTFTQMSLYEADKGGAGGGPVTGQESGPGTGAGNPNTQQPPQTLEDALAILERTSKALKDANKEAADRRKRLEALEKAEADRQAAQLSETDKLKADKQKIENDLKAAQEALKQARLRQAFSTAARKLEKPFISVDAEEDGFRLADLGGVAIGGDGTVTGMEDVLKDLTKNKAYLFGQAQNPRPPEIDATRRGNGSAGTTDEVVAKKRQSAQYSSL
ncbi:MAG: hypothetical protein ACOYYS_19780 [Chloroflexota bacterium]